LKKSRPIFLVIKECINEYHSQDTKIASGNPGERDDGRIAHVALEVAGLKQIDHYITTHWHKDHVGGIPRLTQLIPVKLFKTRKWR